MTFYSKTITFGQVKVRHVTGAKEFSRRLNKLSSVYCEGRKVEPKLAKKKENLFWIVITAVTAKTGRNLSKQQSKKWERMQRVCQANESLMRRMQNIVKKALEDANNHPSVPAESTEIGTEQQLLVSNVTRYSKKIDPNERRAEAIKRKLNQNFVDSSASEDETTDTASKKPKLKRLT
ncbi:hypothetical protein AC249_AIPGENE21176 [Exaiptasia diaphana]|nr:hypothetical protein AC249_AIPGENE21176 [Exaiptasia diaphana]